MTSATSAHLDNATLRERILTSGAGNARGSLTKVASLYRDFVHQLVMRGNEDLSAAATDLKTELLLHDLETRKLILSSQAYHGNSSAYNSTLSQMQSSLTTIQHDIETLTLTLVQQRQVHSRRKEYNAIAKISNEKHPPIHTTQTELNKVISQIQQVEEEVGEATAELNLREKQLRVLMSCLGDLKASLREEDIKKNVHGDSAAIEENISCEKITEKGALAAAASSTGGGTKRKRDDN